MFNTPILLITFNRPTHTRRVLEAILAAEPRDLYIFQDGAREGNATDVQKCQEVREIINELTVHCASCTVHHNYSPINLGCGPSPMTGINWFFENVEQGIIIEDDALPHPDFFRYCEELLQKYKDNEDIRAIGSMHLDTRTYGDGSYYFSMMNRTFCAWATWRRAWADFDLYHRDVTRKQFDTCLKQYGCGLRMREYWCERLAEVQKDALNHTSWDQQFWMSIWLHQGKGIMPNVNLSTNIGFDAEGTHTTNANSSGANRPTYAILPLTHPSSEKIWHLADQRFQEIYFEPWNYGKQGFSHFVYRWNKRIKRWLGHEGPWFSRKKR